MNKRFWIANCSGFIMLEFISIINIFGLIVFFLLFFLNEFIDRQYVRYKSFYLLRQLSLLANYKNQEQVFMEDIAREFKRDAILKNVIKRWKILQNTPYRLEISISCVANAIIWNNFRFNLSLNR